MKVWASSISTGPTIVVWTGSTAGPGFPAKEREGKPGMTDLHPDMKIEVSTTFAVLPDVSARPVWLDPAAMWPPEPGKVMYMLEFRSAGICDQCALTCDEEIRRWISRQPEQLVRERGMTSWYCSCNPDGVSCERHWNGSRYDDRKSMYR